MPVVLMMLFVLLGFGTSQFIAVVAGLVVYNAAVFAEIIRAGIQSLPKGQREAGLAIGLTSFKSRMLIELPQAVRRMMPSLVAQLVVLLKDTSLGYIVAYGELLRAVQLMADVLGPAFLFPVFFVAAGNVHRHQHRHLAARCVDRTARFQEGGRWHSQGRPGCGGSRGSLAPARCL